MKAKPIATLFIAVLLFLSSLSVLIAAQPPTESQITVLSAAPGEMVVELTAPAFHTQTIRRDGQTYRRIIIPGATETDTPGLPQVPVRGTLLNVPDSASLTILDTEAETLTGYRPSPAPALVTSAKNNPQRANIKTVFAPSRAATDTFFPGQLAELGQTGIQRYQPVTPLRFFPVQTNPVTGETLVYHRIRVKITWPKDAPLAVEPPAHEPVVATVFTPTVKIGVTADGIYQVTPADVTATGFDLGSVGLDTLKMTTHGTEIPIFAHDDNADNLFNGNDYLLFYGTAITDIYTTENIYWLSGGGAPGLRMAQPNAGPSGGATVPTDFPTTLHAEEDTFYWQTMPNGTGQDHWFWEDTVSPNSSTLPEYRDFPLTLNAPSPVAVTATLRVRLHAYTSLSHRTQIYLNNTLVDDQSWSGQITFTHQILTIPHTLLISGQNTVRVQAVDTGASVDETFINWIELDYRDTYTATGDVLRFAAPQAGLYQFDVTNFSTADVQVFDITTPTQASLLTNTAVSMLNGRYTVSAEQTATEASRFLALTPAQYQTPASFILDQPSSWRSSANAADYIIITHNNFYTSALTLAQHREITTGLRTAVVKTTDIYDEFNAGVFNPNAIHSFLAYAFANWQSPAPAYVLLIGDSTQDYRNNLSPSVPIYVPSLIAETDDFGQTPSDNGFVTVSGDDVLPDMAIGRLPAQSAAEVDAMVAKIIGYEQTPVDAAWHTQALFVADDDETTFETTSDQLAQSLPYYYTATTVYVADYASAGDSTADIIAGFNSGSGLVNYTGHGNADRWAQENIFNVNNVGNLSNAGHLPVVTVANCLNGYFTSKTVTSMAEQFLRTADAGAVAMWAPTGLGYPTGHRTLMEAFYDNIFQNDVYRLGEATSAAKATIYAQSTFWDELVNTFILFGDPALALNLPANFPYPTSISPADGSNNVPLDDDITIRFNKPVVSSTVSLGGPGTISLPFTATWNTDDTSVTYSHPHFAPGTSLTFTITGQDKLGNPLQDGQIATTWQFTTTTDATPPGVTLGFSGGHSGTSLLPNGTVVVTFTEAVRVGSVVYSITPTVTGWLNWDTDSRATFYHFQDFPTEQVFTFTVSAAKDLAGNSLPQAAQLTFNTMNTARYVYLPLVVK